MLSAEVAKKFFTSPSDHDNKQATQHKAHQGSRTMMQSEDREPPLLERLSETLVEDLLGLGLLVALLIAALHLPEVI